MKNALTNVYENYGCLACIIVAILAFALVFGLLCANAALLMVCWNFAVVAAVSVCAPIGFWQALVLILALAFLLGKGFMSIFAKSTNND